MSEQFWSSLQFFDKKEIRTYFYAEQNLWLFSAVDICNALIETDELNKHEHFENILKKNNKSGHLNYVRILVNGEWINVDVLQKEEILQVLTYLESTNVRKFAIWLDGICKSVPEGCYLPKNAREYEFLNLACNRFLDLYHEVNGNNFMQFSPEIRLYKIKELFNVYSELLSYEPIKKHIGFLKKARPPMESVLSNEFIKFIRNVLAHFPFFSTWDEICITKSLVNWVSEGKTIDRFLNKYKGSNEVQYRFMDAKSRKWRYSTISFPKDYGDDKIYIKDMISEKDGILLCAVLMYRVVMSQIIKISDT
jgi:hypothetical protein